MNITVEDLAPCKKLLRVEVATEKVNEAFDAVTKNFQKQAALPGFRPGKAPRDLIAKRFESQIEEEVKNKLTRESFQNALKEKKLSVVNSSDFEEVQFGRGLSYQFIVKLETAPEFDLPEYKGLPAKQEKGQVTEADVERALTLLRERQTKYETVNREAKENDVAVVNYLGTCEGQPITALAPTARGLTEQKAFWIDLRPGAFIPGFSEQLIGAKAGDKRTVNVDFPADFVTPQLQGKKGVYETEVVEVKEKHLLDLDDTLAKAYGAENLDKLQEGVRRDLENELKYKLDSSLRDQVVGALLSKVQCELPESTVANETRNIVYNIVNENQRRGVSPEDLQEQKEQIYASANLTAKDRVKAAFLFKKIAAKENIQVEKQDIFQRVKLLAQKYEMSLEKFAKELKKQNGIQEITDQLLNEKVVNFLLQNAKIESGEPTKPAAKT